MKEVSNQHSELVAMVRKELMIGPKIRNHVAVAAFDSLVEQLQTAERKAEVARIQGLAPEDAQRYFAQRDEWADRADAAERERDGLLEQLETTQAMVTDLESSERMALEQLEAVERDNIELRSSKILRQTQEQLETLRAEMQFINDAAMSFHKGEEGKARALNVIGARSGNALLGSNPASGAGTSSAEGTNEANAAGPRESSPAKTRSTPPADPFTDPLTEFHS